jgi:hypothetical protein
MDADLMITIAFGLEALFLALAAAVFAAHEVRKSRSQVASSVQRHTNGRSERHEHCGNVV